MNLSIPASFKIIRWCTKSWYNLMKGIQKIIHSDLYALLIQGFGQIIQAYLSVQGIWDSTFNNTFQFSPTIIFSACSCSKYIKTTCKEIYSLASLSFKPPNDVKMHATKYQTGLPSMMNRPRTKTAIWVSKTKESMKKSLPLIDYKEPNLKATAERTKVIKNEDISQQQNIACKVSSFHCLNNEISKTLAGSLIQLSENSFIPSISKILKQDHKEAQIL